MNETDLNSNDIEQFFNFGGAKQTAAPMSPKVEIKLPAEIKPIIIETLKPETEGMTYVGEIPNHPTRKFYPERTFDKYVKKDARLEENDVEMLKAWANNISHFKRKLGLNNGSSNRITDNTIMRIILSEFCNKMAVAFKDPSYKEVTNEDELRQLIAKFIK
jgi:hypothetical protein